MRKILNIFISGLGGEYCFSLNCIKCETLKDNSKINNDTKNDEIENKESKKCNYPNISRKVEPGYFKIRYDKINCKIIRNYITKNNVVIKISNKINPKTVIYRTLSFSPAIEKNTLLTDWQGQLILNENEINDTKDNCHLISLNFKVANKFERYILYYINHPIPIIRVNFWISLISIVVALISLGITLFHK